MSLTNPNKLITEERLSDFYQQILPYMGGMPEVVNNKFSKGNLYSTDEKMIGQWIDGKPLYQKTVVGNSSTNIILADSVSPNIEQIIDMKYRVGWLYSSEHMYYYGNSYKNDNNIFRLAVSTDTNWKPISINPMSGSYFANKELIVTIQYTKTTDSPISIGSDTDYSTDEKIVGTWIDGKPIYQKTFTGLNVNVPVGSASTNWTNLVQIENIEMAINIACFTSSKQLISMNEVNISNNYVQVQGTFEARTIVTAILQYTKSTD